MPENLISLLHTIFLMASCTLSHTFSLSRPPLFTVSTSPSNPSKHHLPHHLHLHHRLHKQSNLSNLSEISRRETTLYIINCTSNSTPIPESNSQNQPETTYELERKTKSDMLQQVRSPSSLDRPKPPNFEIGWKRTKDINLIKPKGFMIMDFLEKLEGLITRKEYGSTQLLAKVGEVVAERAREEAEVLREGGEVEERMITELFRVLKLIEMDLEMVRAAVKEETLNERLEQAKARCRQAILVANSF